MDDFSRENLPGGPDTRFPEAPLNENAGGALPVSPDVPPANAGGALPVAPDVPPANADFGGFEPVPDPNGGYPNGGYPSYGGYPPQNGQYYGSAGTGPADTPYGAPQGGNYPPPNYREMQENRGQAVSVVSLVFGILSVVCCWTFVLPFIFGIVALICGIVGAVKHQKKALWIIGIITGVLGIVLAVMLVVSLIPLLTALIAEAERRGGDLTPQDIQRILRQYGIEINLSAKFILPFIR